jgi:hypothetical protein
MISVTLLAWFNDVFPRAHYFISLFTMADTTRISFSRYQALVPILEINGANFIYWRQEIKTLLKYRGLTNVMPSVFPEEVIGCNFKLSNKLYKGLAPLMKLHGINLLRLASPLGNGKGKIVPCGI